MDWQGLPIPDVADKAPEAQPTTPATADGGQAQIAPRKLHMGMFEIDREYVETNYGTSYLARHRPSGKIYVLEKYESVPNSIWCHWVEEQIQIRDDLQHAGIVQFHG